MLIGFFTYLGWVQMWTDAAADADAERDGFRHIPDNAMVDHHPLVRRGGGRHSCLYCLPEIAPLFYLDFSLGASASKREHFAVCYS